MHACSLHYNHFGGAVIHIWSAVHILSASLNCVAFNNVFYWPAFKDMYLLRLVAFYIVNVLDVLIFVAFCLKCVNYWSIFKPCW